MPNDSENRKDLVSPLKGLAVPDNARMQAYVWSNTRVYVQQTDSEFDAMVDHFAKDFRNLTPAQRKSQGFAYLEKIRKRPTGRQVIDQPAFQRAYIYAKINSDTPADGHPADIYSFTVRGCPAAPEIVGDPIIQDVRGQGVPTLSDAAAARIVLTLAARFLADITA